MAPVTGRTELRVVCAQLDGHNASRQARTEAATAAVARAASGSQEATLVVLPELWPVGFFHFDDYAALAEPLHGPTLNALADAARTAQVWVYGGSFVERDDRGRLFNTGCLVDDHGALRLTYRKLHLFGLDSSERALLTPGLEAPVAATPWGIVGAATCYDLRFPELFRELALGGATLLVVASAWPMVRLEQWRILLRARAVENQAFVIACNAAGDDAGRMLAGHSAVISPLGEVIAEAGTGETTLEARIDPQAATRARNGFPFLDDRRYTVTLDRA
ncbi:MAG: nitrilase-related carbon-nitrogen hydrolase [Egibacteraceae bacterium]